MRLGMSMGPQIAFVEIADHRFCVAAAPPQQLVDLRFQPIVILQ